MAVPKGTKLHPKYVGLAKGPGNRTRPKTYVYLRFYDRKRRCMAHWKGSGIWFEGFTPSEVHALILTAGRAARAEKMKATTTKGQSNAVNHPGSDRDVQE